MQVTSDAWILKTIEGCDIEFIQRPQQNHRPFAIKLNQQETSIIDEVVDKLLQKRVTELTCHSKMSISQPFSLGPRKTGATD